MGVNGGPGRSHGRSGPSDGSGVVAKLKGLLALPETADLALDDPATTQIRASILQRKRFLRRLYCEWYSIFKTASEEAPHGLHVELGSGPGFLKEFIRQVITSEVMAVSSVDAVFSAEAMPFGEGRVAALYLADVFHHIARPRAFLAEAVRCLAPGGRIVMIEPYNTRWARWVWRSLHHEPFEVDASWELAGTGPLSSANVALPWIIFDRDRAVFEKEFPSLRLLELRPFMPFCYLLSGGLSMRSLAPGFAYPICRGIEKVLAPFNTLLGLFAVIQLERTRADQVSSTSAF